MRLENVKAASTIEVSIETTRVGDFQEIEPMMMVGVRRISDSLVSIELGGRRIIVKPGDSYSSLQITQLSATQKYHGVVVVSDETTAVVKIWSFTRTIEQVNEVVTFQLSDEVLNSIAKLLNTAVSIDQIRGWLAGEFLIDTDRDGIYAFVIRADPKFELFKSGFVLVGQSREMDIRILNSELVAVRLAPAREDSFLISTFVISKVQFSSNLDDLGVSESPLVSNLKNDSYLKMWQKYSDLELSVELDSKESLGEAEYSSSKEYEEGLWRFTLLEPSNFLRQLTLDFTLEAFEIEGRKGGTRFIGNVLDINDRRRTVDLQSIVGSVKPPETGFLRYSVAGTAKSYERRNFAATRINNESAPIPGLAKIIEMRSAKPARVDRILSWDSPAVRAIFKNSEPTEAQKRAIEIALNTPDIAIIQGPPGTGKTKVISAIAVRAAEEMRSKAATRQVLLSSFQHEAVDNVSRRTEVFGLPTIKESGKFSSQTWLTTWRNEKLREVKSRFSAQAQGVLSLKRNDIAELLATYVALPVIDFHAGEILEDLASDLSTKISGALADELLALASKLKRSKTNYESEKTRNLISSIRRIRITPESFEDDGLINVRAALERTRSEKVQHLDLSSLHFAARGEPISKDLFQSLETAKNELLSEFMLSSIQTSLPSRNELVVCILKRLLEEIDRNLKVSGQGLSHVISRFIDDLESDKVGVESCLGDYAAAISATCQGAGGLTANSGKSTDVPTFDTVIVDEAARANPLDLQIPMAIASRRIILVGDQRQLPHIVDKQIANTVISSAQEIEELEESLFGRLFHFLEDERRIGRPDRVVSLNQQFRMHPELGAFVSKNFYEPFGESIESPRPESEFQHDIPTYEGKFAVWIDVPRGKGLAKRDENNSSFRECEAMVVAQEAKNILEKNSKLTLGIVTFYRAQANLILDYLLELGIASRDPDRNRVEIKESKWKFTINEDGEQVERLRVGSVDSFQGKEFDVAMLSTVRTPNMNSHDPSQVFGHLRIMNRLCVALSRQKKLLIVVGDRQGITKHPLSAVTVPPLCAFSEICQ